jgi:hypothetical protein
MSEPMYDDATLEYFKEEQRKDLVGQIWQYVLSLEEYIIRLRNQVNSLSEGQQPFPDPASDYTLSFYDHPAYPEFAEVLMDGEPFSKIDG